jgi:Zn-dependent protease with chaperone function
MRHGHADVPPGRILEDGPASLSEFGGYVAGVGPWKHIVLRRGTVERNTGSEALWTFGHELGHYALFHPEKELATDALVLFLFMCTAGRMTTWLLARWGPRWGLRGIDDLATLPLLLLLIGGVTFIEAPALNLTRRHQEHEADRYAVEVTHGIVPDPGRAAVLSLQDAEGVDSLNRDPSPFAQFWLQTHPTTADRIRFVTTYDPWSAGGKPKYVR